MYELKSKVSETLNKIVELFKSGDVPAAVSIATFPPFDVPSNSWSHKKANHHVFCLAEVEEWINANWDSEKTNRLKSQRSLKRYYLFSVYSIYLGEVIGSKALTERLKTMETYDHHYPYGVDEDGYVYFFYSGKLRKHESVHSMAGVIVSSRYPEKVQALMEIVYERYINSNFRLKKEAGGISSP